MKKFALPGIFILSLMVTTAKAQFTASKEEGTKPSGSAHAVAATKANYKALKGFRKNFADGNDVTWHTGPQVITASMDREGKKIEVVFNRKGRWIRNMLVYPESLLDKNIRKDVRQVYYDHRITLVQEFKEDDITFYIIHLEDATSFMQLVYHEGAMKVHQQFRKQL